MLNNFRMKQAITPPLHAHPAHLWDGYRQLPGTLELWEQQLVFRFANFRDSHLNLTIQFSDIEKVEEFLIYNLARNGLRIIGKDGKADDFVMEESHFFKKLLEARLNNR